MKGYSPWNTYNFCLRKSLFLLHLEKQFWRVQISRLVGFLFLFLSQYFTLFYSLLTCMISEEKLEVSIEITLSSEILPSAVSSILIKLFFILLVFLICKIYQYFQSLFRITISLLTMSICFAGCLLYIRVMSILTIVVLNPHPDNSNIPATTSFDVFCVSSNWIVCFLECLAIFFFLIAGQDVPHKGTAIKKPSVMRFRELKRGEASYRPYTGLSYLVSLHL